MIDLTKTHIVTVDWLAANLQHPDLIIFDGSWHLPTENRDARADYTTAHIPGALFFDLDDLSDDISPLPHMLPSPIKFASRLKRIGVGDGVAIVAYDTKGLFSAARVWWTFRALGHNNVAVLDGGLPNWRRAGLPLTDQPPAPRQPRHFTPRLQTAHIADISSVKAALAAPASQIADARPASRFAGHAPEPRPGLRSGHMPNARNIPHTDLLNADGTLKSPSEIRAIFTTAGCDLTAPSSPRAALASPRPYSLSHSQSPVTLTTASTTAPGPNGGIPNQVAM